MSRTTEQTIERREPNASDHHGANYCYDSENADNHLPVDVGTLVRMFKAQISDGEQIECEDYEVGDRGVELYDAEGEFIAFVPFTHLVYVGNITDDGQMVW